jgi:hypothetical protein
MLANHRRIIFIAAVIAFAFIAEAQVKKNTTKGNPVRKPFPIIIYPGYSYQLCSKPTPESKCYEVPSEFIAEFTENSHCAGLTLKVVNSTEPEKLPHWYWELVDNKRHPFWFVRIMFDPRLSVIDLPQYIGEVIGPDGVSHQLGNDLSSTDPSPMRAIVGKTCALASGEKLRGGNVEP